MQKYFLYFSLNVLILCMCVHSCYFKSFHFIKAGTEVCSVSYTFNLPLFYLDYMQYMFIGTPKFTYLSSLNCRSSMKRLKKKFSKEKINYLWFHYTNTTSPFLKKFSILSHLHIWYLYCSSHSRNATLYSAFVFFNNYLHFPYHL